MINKTFVGILMGSDSDLPIMQDAAKVLEELGIGCEVHTLSAHRTPEAVVEYVKKGESVVTKCSSAAPEAPVFRCRSRRGAYLASCWCSYYEQNHAGVDALFSTVQMPPGIP